MKERTMKERTNTLDPTYRWIGVDLDETLAEYNGEACGLLIIGKPIPKMVNRVKKWLNEGKMVKIVTARVSDITCSVAGQKKEDVIKAIHEWCKEHIGESLLVTSEKDHGMIELWDDRVVRVIPNTGERYIEG